MAKIAGDRFFRFRLGRGFAGSDVFFNRQWSVRAAVAADGKNRAEFSVNFTAAFFANHFIHRLFLPADFRAVPIINRRKNLFCGSTDSLKVCVDGGR